VAQLRRGRTRETAVDEPRLYAVRGVSTPYLNAYGRFGVGRSVSCIAAPVFQESAAGSIAGEGIPARSFRFSFADTDIRLSRSLSSFGSICPSAVKPIISIG
jgi:hypothetical protein